MICLKSGTGGCFFKGRWQRDCFSLSLFCLLWALFLPWKRRKEDDGLVDDGLEERRAAKVDWKGNKERED
jgi:hypothetical protein